MNKVRIIIDWIIYWILILALSFILATGIYYISELAEYGVEPSIRMTFIWGYALFRTIFAPILLIIFTLGRLIDKNFRNTPIILKRKL